MTLTPDAAPTLSCWPFDVEASFMITPSRRTHQRLVRAADDATPRLAGINARSVAEDRLQVRGVRRSQEPLRDAIPFIP